jgi:hypothetical protein
MFCREHVVQLHDQIDRIHGAGAELVVIGNGAAHFIAGFRDVTNYRGVLYTDPSLESYKAAALRRGWGTVLRPSILVNAVRTLSHGHTQGVTRGDSTQQGGVLVILPGGAIAYHHISEVAGDNADPKLVVQALERAVQPVRAGV